ncbi:hypothetical protein Ciccas_008984 [Cichlidogyrus casuarinus]|uniref:FIP-RBD domain-containing protein n=1 Tax=Cichlidogyrus casuarinus TaxID=1844966 RepID=A0ABD2PYC8_9PLAT
MYFRVAGSKLVSEESYESLIRRLTLENKTLTELLQHTQTDLLAQRTANRHGMYSVGSDEEEEMDRSYYNWINEPIPRNTNKSLAEELDGLGETELKTALVKEKETSSNLRNYLDKILNVIMNTHHVGLLEIATAKSVNMESAVKPFHEVHFLKQAVGVSLGGETEEGEEQKKHGAAVLQLECNQSLVIGVDTEQVFSLLFAEAKDQVGEGVEKGQVQMTGSSVLQSGLNGVHNTITDQVHLQIV